MTKILVPTDFSPGSAIAVRTAIQLAKATGAELVVAHAWQVPALAYASEPFSMAPALLQTMSDDAQRALAAAVTEAKLQHPATTGTMVTGVAWARLVELAQRDPEIELIVMGSHGRTGLERVLLGSVSEKVVRHAPCSTLVARDHGESRPFTDILVPIDFAPSSQGAIEQAARMAKTFRARITLLHVVEAPMSLSGELLDTSLVRELDQAATAALEDLAATLEKQLDAPVSTRARIGHVGGEILAALDHHPFDLVVMGSHGRTGIERVLLGSTAEKIVRHAKCSVLVARAR